MRPQPCYIKGMKTVATLALLLSTVAVPAAACDLHGMFGRHYTPISKWESFTPLESDTDALDAQAGSRFDRLAPSKTAPARPKPSFANAADRAVRRAQAMRLMKAKEEAKKEARKVAEADGSNPDIQPVGQAAPQR